MMIKVLIIPLSVYQIIPLLIYNSSTLHFFLIRIFLKSETTTTCKAQAPEIEELRKLEKVEIHFSLLIHQC